MKAVQTRSPIHLAYKYANLNNVIVSIWVSDSPDIDSTTTPDYQLNSQAINDFASVEISELIRSKNDYIFNSDFYTKRDTAKYALVKAVLLDDNQTQLEVKYDFLRVRDGYVQRVNDVTEKELPQIYKNLIPTDITSYTANTNTSFLDNREDPFSGDDAYLASDINDSGNVSVRYNELNKTGTYTFSVWIKQNKANSNIHRISFNASISYSITLNIATSEVLNIAGNIMGYDVYHLNGFLRVSIFANFTELNPLNGFQVISFNGAEEDAIVIFNPKIIDGNQIENEARDLILQDNFTIFGNQNIDTYISFNLKDTNGGFFYNSTETIISNQATRVSKVTKSNTTFAYDQLDDTRTTQQVTYIELNECKHTPTKVSFINRFGVIQDLVFFKKRTDNIDTDKESFKTNVLQQGNYYSHIGQNQTIRKESKRSVTLNSGFYPEEFNIVFEQLQNSLHYWIDDEPAVLEGSSFNVKTRVNDKLINYTFDFKYSNEEVNTI